MVKAEEKTEQVYNIPGTWVMSGVVQVHASSFDEAKERAADMELPSDADYIEGSFSVIEETEEMVRYNQVKEVVFVSEGEKTGTKLPVGRTATVYGIKDDAFIVEIDGKLAEVQFCYAQPIR